MIKWEKFFFISLSIFLRIFKFSANIFFQPSLWKLISLSVLMFESWFFYCILTTYQRWFPKNFVKICLILTSKISLENFGKNIDFQKSPKKIRTKQLKINYFFLHFLNSWVPRKRGKVRHSQKYEKKWKSLHPNGHAAWAWTHSTALIMQHVSGQWTCMDARMPECQNAEKKVSPASLVFR